MKMGISRWAIDTPTPVLLLFALLTLLGIGSYMRLPLGGMPRVELPIVQVQVQQPGATPVELEANVAKKIERALGGLAGLKNQTSEISEGSVSVVAEFMLEADLDRATQDVREAISRVRPELPSNVTEPMVTRVDTSGGVQLAYAVRADGLSAVELTRRIDEDVIPVLLGVDGVQQAQRLGGARREFRVELDPERLAAYGLGVDSVFRQLQAAEANLPGGAIRVGGSQRSVRLTSASASATTLGARPIAVGDGSVVRLDEVARVFDAGSVPQGYALLDGRPVVVIQISKSRNASETDMADGVAEMLKLSQTGIARGMEFELFYDAVDYTRETYASARATLIEGALLTVFVVLLFLRSWRATVVAALAIPFSLLPTFLAMSALGFSLNILTLLALILVIGILVDDAIVEVENIERRIERGEPPRDAARNGADAIGLAVVAITMTIVAVFLPVSFIKGVVGQYFREFGLTASVAVLASLVVARLLTPILCAWLLKPRKHVITEEPIWVRRYGRMLAWTLHHRKTTLLIALGVLIATFGLIAMVPTGFLPNAKPNFYQVQYEFAPNVTEEMATQRADGLRRALADIAEIEHVFVSNDGSTYNGTARIVLAPRDERKAGHTQIEQAIRTRISALPDVRAQLMLGDSGIAKQMNLSFQGDNGKELETFVRDLTAQAKTVPGIIDVGNTVPMRSAGFDLKIDSADAARLGVAAQDVANMLTIATLSGLDTLLPRVPVANEQVPIRIRIAGGDRIDGDRLLTLPVATADGGSLPLASIAQLVPSENVASIRRLDRQRVVDLGANFDGLTLSQAMKKIRALPAYATMPDSVQFAEYGDAQYMSEMFQQFGLAILLGFGAVYAVLVLLFRDWLQPVTIMLALPLALGGAALALLISGHSLNLSTVIGLLMLFGIVGKNSILLVDFIVEARATGVERGAAVLQAGRERVRPILMTTLAMVGGMLPAAIGFGQDDGFRAPMAIAVIGGLLASTVLSLLLVPMAYTLMDDLERWLTRGRKLRVQAASA